MHPRPFWNEGGGTVQRLLRPDGRGGTEMTELPNPEVFEHWEENVETWRNVQAVFDWIRGDRDLFDALMKIHRGEVTVREGFAQYQAVLVERGELPAPIGP